MLSLVLSSVVLIRSHNSKSRGADNGGKLAAFCVIYLIIKVKIS